MIESATNARATCGQGLGCLPDGRAANYMTIWEFYGKFPDGHRVKVCLIGRSTKPAKSESRLGPPIRDVSMRDNDDFTANVLTFRTQLSGFFAFLREPVN